MPVLLVVDDHDELRRTTAMVFTALGWDCETAGSAPEALALLKGHECFDAALVDLVMPFVSGVAVLNECIRVGLPAMALTGLDEQAARKFCPACVSVVTKPLDYYAVDEILRRHVRMYRLSGMMTRSGQVEQS